MKLFVYAVIVFASFCLSGRADDVMVGKIKVDGSSTVFPITSATAEMFKSVYPKIDVKIGVSGTGNGFKKFLDAQPELRIDIADASRPIKQTEVDKAKSLGIEYIEIPIALDGLAVVVNPKNTFCSSLTINELKAIWSKDSKLQNWKDVRAGFPDVPLKLYGPGVEDGTYDYFVEAVIGGDQKNTRSDFNASENDSTLVTGVAGDVGALGYFGLSYYEANKNKLKILGIDNGSGIAVAPSLITVRENLYRPLSRPLFIYVNVESSKRPEVVSFISYLLDNAEKIVEHPKVGYVALPKSVYEVAKKRFADKVTGTIFNNPGTHSMPLTKVYGTE